MSEAKFYGAGFPYKDVGELLGKLIVETNPENLANSVP